MAKACLILGASGTGKSTSIGNVPELNIKGLDPKETLIINVKGKPLPFKNWMKGYTPFEGKTGNYLSSCDFSIISSVLLGIEKNRPEIKNVVIDDFQYLMAEYFMQKALVKGYDKFNELAKYTYDVLNLALSLGQDMNVIVLSHSEESPITGLKIKTVGKMLDDKVDLEGLFTVVLYTDQIMQANTKTVEKRFVTNFDGTYPAKSPIGMFKEKYIPNDLAIVIESMKKYY